MFGHTHKPYIEIDEDVTILNPGSVSYPRQSDHMPTFLIMEIDDEGEAHYGHGYYKSKFSEIKIWRLGCVKGCSVVKELRKLLKKIFCRK